MVASVYFFVPNLIGYTRIILAALSFYYIQNHWMFFTCYSVSSILDIADGHAARALKQSSRFGAILDMITDRAATSCLLVNLAQFYPKYTLWFQFLIALDIMSHMAHIMCSYARGSVSHKTVNEKQNFLLRMYYTNRLLLGFLCAGNEGFFILCYMMHFWAGPEIPLGPLAPLAAYFGYTSSHMEMVRAFNFFACFPVMFIKQSMNLIQLRQAAIDIVELDVKEREAAAVKKQ